MRRRTRLLAGGAAAALALTMVPAPATAQEAAVPGLAPPGAVFNGKITDENGQPLVGCTPDGRADNPHPSQGGRDVSGHGVWYQGDCENDTATVQIALYEYYTDGTWRRKAYNKDENLKAGGGSSRRINARRTCDTKQMTSWRNHVDVDVNWEVDSSGQSVRQNDVPCRVTGPDA